VPLKSVDIVIAHQVSEISGGDQLEEHPSEGAWAENSQLRCCSVVEVVTSAAAARLAR
jgi:hypothetical protein